MTDMLWTDTASGGSGSVTVSERPPVGGSVRPLSVSTALGQAPSPAALRVPFGASSSRLAATAFMRRYRRYAILFDLLALVAGTGIACLVRFGDQATQLYAAFGLILLPVWFLVVTSQRGYETRYLGTGPEEYRRMLNSGLLLMAVLAIAAYSVKYELSRGYLLVAVPTTIAIALIGRKLLRARVYQLRLEGRGLQRVLVVGEAESAVATVDQLHRQPEHGLVAVGLCVPKAEISVSHLHDVPVLGGMDDVVAAARAADADVVAVVSHPDLSGIALRRLAWALEDFEVELVVSPGIIEVAGPRLSIRPVAGLSLLHLEHPAASGGRLMLKAMLDRVLAATLLVLVSPLLAVVALAVKFTSPGPVLYRQTRIGIAGEPFTMLKFRSMVDGAHNLRDALVAHNEADGVLFKIRNDPRITPVGSLLRRYSIDELPQLWNVVRGEMSLVGPRPPLPEEVRAYDSDAHRRLRVRPGLTGLWQVSGRSDLDWEESLRLDLRYVDNWSWSLDLSILLRTGRAILGRAGAY